MNKPQLIVNFILALFILIILCNSRKITETYVEESDDVIMQELPDAADPDEIVDDDIDDVDDEDGIMDDDYDVDGEDELMDDDYDDDLAMDSDELVMPDDVELVDSVAVEASLPTVSIMEPEPAEEELGYYNFAKVMYF